MRGPTGAKHGGGTLLPGLNLGVTLQRDPNSFIFSVSTELPQTTLTLEPPFPEIFTGETVTLRCGVEGGSAGWKYLWYKDSEDTPVLQTAGRIITGDSYTITAAAVSDSDPVTLTVSDQWVILQTPPQPVFEGDSLTLRCRVWSYTATRVVFYKDNKQLQYRAGTELSVDRVSKSDEGSYICRAWWWNTTSWAESSSESAEVRVSVRELFNTPTLTVLPGASVWEGEAVTLHCGAHINKQGTQLQYRYSKDNGTVRGAGSQDQHSIPAAGLRDTGRYQCEVEAAGTGLKKRSASVSLTVRALFSRVTLTASPGVTVKEGEVLNLTCEAAVNKIPRPELHYTIVRDGEPVTNSTDSALYSIASTEKSHTGSYTCAVESQGVKKSSQELHIEVQRLCTLGAVGCFMAGVQLLHSRVELLDGGSRGGVQFMTAALLVCASRPSHKEYSHMQGYRVS
ncbi:UNVERIFIED_CONTAM: hypothetical protein FKN15_061529 [Acipenser sinensis]